MPETDGDDSLGRNKGFASLIQQCSQYCIYVCTKTIFPRFFTYIFGIIIIIFVSRSNLFSN